jgi:hypothetical protein
MLHTTLAGGTGSDGRCCLWSLVVQYGSTGAARRDLLRSVQDGRERKRGAAHTDTALLSNQTDLVRLRFDLDTHDTSACTTLIKGG